MPSQPQPATLAEVIRRSAEVVDPEGADPDVSELVVRFEDEDEPVTAVEDVEERLAEAAGALDPQQESGPLQLTTAIATYLAHRRDELAEEPDELVRLAVRAEFEGEPPPPVADWLALNDVDV